MSPSLHVPATTRRPVTPRRYDGNARPSLVVVAGARRGAVVELRAAESMIGRGAGATMVLPDSGVSREHAKILRATDGIYNLIDLDSTNGVLVNGVRVEVTVLREGDRLQIGPDALLRFTYQPELELPTPLVEPNPLSERQLEVAKLVCVGLTNADIAERLGLSPRTVTSHLDHIYTRLDIGSRAELAHYLTKRNLA